MHVTTDTERQEDEKQSSWVKQKTKKMIVREAIAAVINVLWCD